MTLLIRTAVCSLFLLALFAAETPAQPAPGKYKNFRTAIYVVVNNTKQLADPKVFEREYGRVSRQLKFDKVYLEVYRNHVFATDAEIETVKKEFAAKGIIVSGGVTLAAGGEGGQFGTFDYEIPADREECRKASELAARHFDEVILDDFFFYTSKSDADIVAKGARSWTQYRLDTMRDAARNLVLGPARAVNPNVKMIIKYPNWYEHFQGLGYDLEQESQMFDGIYTGTETRDPLITDQLLQQYESYGIVRYFDNIRPNGGNGGGWVDTYSLRYIDRYAEQLWDTLFAKAPEITLFNWFDMAGPPPPAPGMFAPRSFEPGERKAWANLHTSFDWNAMVGSYRSTGKGDPGPGWARAAGYSLEQVDKVLGELGKPVGIASYKPYHSAGEDFLHNYLGNIGIPIEMTPNFPEDAELVLLTESAKFDPGIVAKIERRLAAGKNVVITSGFLKAMQDKGFKDIAEWESTGRTVSIRDFINGFGAGNGNSLNDPKHPNPSILFPEIRFYTNDSWGIVRGVAGAKGYPILLMNRYSKGIICLLTIPENPADLYNLPQGVITQIKTYLQYTSLVRIDSPALVGLFTYANDAFVVESFRDAPAGVNISIAGEGKKLCDLATGKLVAAKPVSKEEMKRRETMRRWYREPPRTVFQVKIMPHSYRAYRIER